MSKTPDLSGIQPISELSRTVTLQALREKRRFTAEIVATPDECEQLAKRYGVLSVNGVQASVVLKMLGPDLIRITCSVSAVIVQECGVSLQPLTQSIHEEHEEIVTTSPDLLVSEEEMVVDPNSPTELIEGDSLDYGEIVAQLVALAIDPFPRAAGAEGQDHIEHANNPFAVLQTLTKPSNSD